MNKKTILKIINVGLLMTFTLITENCIISEPKAFADDSLSTKARNDTDDAKKDIKKGARKGKKNLRDATGHGSVKKDLQDNVDNFKDDVTTEKNKLKRKAE